ncbi:MAG: GreA/GreB family elongation factor [Pseudomonadota bacterium]
MGRWRPPSEPSSPYVTAEGYAALEAEASSLWARRRDTVVALSAAAAEGDRSENAEYIYRKKELREIDRRIRYLQTRMPRLKVVTAVGDRTRVYFGAWVTLLGEDGVEVTYRIVGADELDPAKGTISLDAPLAKRLLKAEVGDEIAHRVGDAVRHFEVTAIRYAE